VRVVGYLPAQHAAPEARQTNRVVGIEANRQELTSQRASHLLPTDLAPAGRRPRPPALTPIVVDSCRSGAGPDHRANHVVAVVGLAADDRTVVAHRVRDVL
jgi:hypothetical protein